MLNARTRSMVQEYRRSLGKPYSLEHRSPPPDDELSEEELIKSLAPGIIESGLEQHLDQLKGPSLPPGSLSDEDFAKYVIGNSVEPGILPQ